MAGAGIEAGKHAAIANHVNAALIQERRRDVRQSARGFPGHVGLSDVTVTTRLNGNKLVVSPGSAGLDDVPILLGYLSIVIAIQAFGKVTHPGVELVERNFAIVIFVVLLKKSF